MKAFVYLRKTFIFSILFALTVSCNSKIKTCSHSSGIYTVALNNYKKDNDTLKFLNIVNSIILDDPLCIDLHNARAELYSDLGWEVLAAHDYEKIILLDSTNVLAYYNLGVLHQHKSEDDSAIDLFQKAIDLKSIQGSVITYNKEFGGKAVYDVSAEKLFYAQAISLYYLNRFSDALNNFNFCIENNFNLAKSHLYRGSIYIKNKMTKDACIDFNEAFLLGDTSASKFINTYCKVKYDGNK